MLTQTIDLGPMFWSIWPVLVVLIVIGLLGAVPDLWRLYRHRRAGLAEVDQMPGLEFEHYLGLLFERLGYKVEVTKAQATTGPI